MLIEGIMLTVAFTGIENTPEKTFTLCLIGVAVLVIYILAIFFMWYQQYIESKKLTQQLKNLQKS